jgi:hypothetical protein
MKSDQPMFDRPALDRSLRLKDGVVAPHRLAHHGAFGNDRFGVTAERFARFFGTPRFIIGQTVLVILWTTRPIAVERSRLVCTPSSHVAVGSRRRLPCGARPSAHVGERDAVNAGAGSSGYSGLGGETIGELILDVTPASRSSSRPRRASGYVSNPELGAIATDIAPGLVVLGIEPGDRVAIPEITPVPTGRSSTTAERAVVKE